MPTVVGGSIAHRLQSDCSPKGSMICGLHAFNTHCVLITDTDLQHAKSAKDFTICFQSLLLTVLKQLQNKYLDGKEVEGIWAASHYCESCTQEVYTGDYDLQSHEITYQGVQIMDRIQSIEVKLPIAGLGSTSLPPEEMTSALDGLKWSLHIKNWRKQPFVRRVLSL